MAAGDVVRELLPALWLIVLPYVTFAARVGCRRFGARSPPHRPRRSGHGPLLDHPLDYLEASLAPIAATVFAASHSVQGRHGMRQPVRGRPGLLPSPLLTTTRLPQLLRTLTLCVIHGILGSFLLVLALLALGAPLAG